MLLELQNVILRMVARGDALETTLNRLCEQAETLVPGIICSILTLDAEGRLHPAAGPSLPDHYSDALDNLPIGPDVGSCGTAAFLGRPVSVTDIDRDPLWTNFKALALPLGLRACWSSPIFSNDGRVIGTFAFYFRETRGPTSLEENIVETCLPLCMIALERQERLQAHSRLAFTDVLTGLPNRARFENDLSACQDDDWGLLLVDIDNLKTVNDTFGHNVGDALIATVGARLSTAVKPFEAYRLGGDEFAVIVNSASAEKAAALAESILASASKPFICNGHTVFSSVTIGAAERNHPGQTPETVRQNADLALYHAKETQRGGFIHHEETLGTAISARFDAIRSVALALDEDRIRAYYQPVVRLDSAEIIGVEALCRMIGRDGSIISASQFHEATKDARVAAALTRSMLKQVARDVGAWLGRGIAFQHVGINISAADFQAGGLSDLLSETFGAEGVPLSHAILEVTESVYISQRDKTVANEIKALRARGLKVALDDFGTGFASLTHLLAVPVDIIKIDKSFVDRLGPGDAGGCIIEGILHIAKGLGIRVVAEGIETADQAERLKTMGCVLGQGYLYSRAVSAEEMTGLLLEGSQEKGTAEMNEALFQLKRVSTARGA
ncbi:putative bifunctional diguanylate cyclase/phosphodiesterase [Rhizobium sp. LjRoot254]|uniref:putative bifunctional diguanylate cyclase/phosphodiesterase n=1 Tax=Rhizobium sp. LjRoot254 TaxID=3342297 RepID=UPI003ECDB4F0